MYPLLLFSVLYGQANGSQRLRFIGAFNHPVEDTFLIRLEKTDAEICLGLVHLRPILLQKSVGEFVFYR